MERLKKSLFKAENGTVVFFFILIFIILFLQFFTRYVLNNSLGWTEEIARVLLICICFVGAVVNAREGSEISLEFTKNRLKPHSARILDLFFIKPITAAIYFWLAGLMSIYATKARQYLSTIKVSKKSIVAIVALSLFLMGLHTTAYIINSLRKVKESPSS